MAQLAKLNGIEQYHLVSALGANSKASNFYLKMKGEIEEAIQKVGLKCLNIYQPSFLTGNRTEHRPMERFFTGLMKFVGPLLIGGLRKYRSIPAETVARAMFNQSLKNEEGVFTYSSDKIKLLV
jgi:uncharacterized protein YbjT (DUF2867 family)